MRSLSLYIHIPFCIRKCSYCDFLSFPAGAEEKKMYAEALIREIRSAGAAERSIPVTSIFIGGGTPSVMPAAEMRAIMGAVHEAFCVEEDAEITMEVNPGTLDDDVLGFIRDHVNRVSMGVQSAEDGELRVLGRIHSFEEARQSFRALREAGIRNLNVDLMSGIPEQTAESWERTLRAVLSLEPEHISAYSLIVEDGTPFMKLYDEGRLPLPDEETERGLYRTAERILKGSGYEHYEISNFARPGHRCRHNMRCWQREDYIGFGIGAASLFRNVRWRNTRSFGNYLRDSGEPEKIRRETETLTTRTAMEEFMFLGLRTADGISSGRFEQMFRAAIREIYGEALDRQVREGVLTEYEPGCFRLTERGIDVSNRVMADYLFDNEWDENE